MTNPNYKSPETQPQKNRPAPRHAGKVALVSVVSCAAFLTACSSPTSRTTAGEMAPTPLSSSAAAKAGVRIVNGQTVGGVSSQAAIGVSTKEPLGGVAMDIRVPQIDCGRNPGSTIGFWGGLTSASDMLDPNGVIEQTGVNAECLTGKTTPEYKPFTENYPQPPQYYSGKLGSIAAGDVLSVSIRNDGDNKEFTLSLTDMTTDKSITKTLPCPTKDCNLTMAIGDVENPSPNEAPLTAIFSPVRFSNAVAVVGSRDIPFGDFSANETTDYFMTSNWEPGAPLAETTVLVGGMFSVVRVNDGVRY